MIKTDWVFLNKDGSVDRASLDVENIPTCGDGKIHKNKGYKVILVGTGMITHPDGLVVADENI